MNARSRWRACVARCRTRSNSFPAPGCPVCVCPEEDVHAAIQLALRDNVILVAFGDMLRVPANVPKAEPRSLEQARGAGGDVRPIASPMEAVKIARENPGREVVFFAAGFETTTAPVAAMVAEGLPPNLSLLLSARLTWPAVAMLLDSEDAGLRRADRTRPCLDHHGAGGMALRAREARHSLRRRRLRSRQPSGRALFGAAPASRRQGLPRQLLHAGRLAERQSRPPAA